MATVVAGKLNKEARIFPAGESTGFSLRIGVQYYDFSTKQKEWTNYEATIFCRNAQQIGFYKKALVAGSIIQITAETSCIKEYNGNHSIGLNDCKLQILFMNESAQPAQRRDVDEYPRPQATQAQREPVYNEGGTINNTKPNQTQKPEVPNFDDIDDPDDDLPF